MSLLSVWLVFPLFDSHTPFKLPRLTRTRSGVSCPPPWTLGRPAALLAHWRSSTSSICLLMSVRWREEKSLQQTATVAAALLEGTTGSRSRSSRPHLVNPDNRVIHSLPSVSHQTTGAVDQTRFDLWSLQLCQKSPSEQRCCISILEDCQKS